jgi:hypothetical protein
MVHPFCCLQGIRPSRGSIDEWEAVGAAATSVAIAIR